MAVSAHTWTVGEVVTAANLNTYLRDNLTDLESQIDAVVHYETGSYSGDGTTDQTISLTDTALVPKYVRIWLRLTSHGANMSIVETIPQILDDSASGGAVLLQAGQIDFWVNGIISVAAGEFHVDDSGTDAIPNSNGITYNYLVLGIH